MTNEYRLILPLHVGARQKIKSDGTLTKPTKKFILNLNNYRNWHYQTLNNTKKMFKEDVATQVAQLPNLSNLWGEVHIHYVVYPGSRRKFDVNNVVSIVDKYFCDAIVEAGKLIDDDYINLPGTSSMFGTVDKANPRVEAIITPHKAK